MPPNKHKKPPFWVAFCVCRLRAIGCEHAKKRARIKIASKCHFVIQSVSCALYKLMFALILTFTTYMSKIEAQGNKYAI